MELRRLRADLILCYKIIHGLVLLPCDKFCNIISNDPTRGHAFKMYTPESRLKGNFFVAVRVIKVWISLPDDVVAADRPSMFIICRLKT